MEKIRILNGIIPDNWTEKVDERETHYKIEVIGSLLSDDNWDKLCHTLRAEFGDNLIEIYSFTDNGVHFEIYLRK